MNPSKKRIRGHILDKIEALERALISFVTGVSKSREVQHFNREELKELENFLSAVSLMQGKLRRKLLSVYKDRTLSPQEKARLPEAIKVILFPTEEQRLELKEFEAVARSYLS